MGLIRGVPVMEDDLFNDGIAAELRRNGPSALLSCVVVWACGLRVLLRSHSASLRDEIYV